MKHNEAARGTKIARVPGERFTFDSMLDETCERLLDRQLRYSIQRIRELEGRLRELGDELDEFLRARHPSGARARSCPRSATGPS